MEHITAFDFSNFKISDSTKPCRLCGPNNPARSGMHRGQALLRLVRVGDCPAIARETVAVHNGK
jgi:hypothetical protein